MNFLTSKDVSGLRMGTMASMLLVWIFLGVLVGGAAGIAADSYFVFWSVFAFSIWACNEMVVRGAVKKINRKVERMKEGAFGKLGKVDYYNLSLNSVIAVDVAANEVAVCSGKERKNDAKPAVSFNVQKMLGYEMQSMGSTVESLSDAKDSGGIGAASRAATRNARSAHNAMLATGIVFRLDDLSLPTVFAQMSADDSDKWRLLLSKLMEAKLEPTQEPVRYPTPVIED